MTGGTLGLSALSIWGLFYGIMAGLCYALTAIIGKLAGYGTDAFVMSCGATFGLPSVSWSGSCGSKEP